MTPRRGLELPQLELDCMIALWRAGASGQTALQIRQSLASRGRPLAHTTVLTVLQRLQQKGAVAAARHGRRWQFLPRISREQMRAGAVKRLIQNYFDSPDDLRRFLTAVPARGPAAPAAPAGSAPRSAPSSASAPSTAALDSSLL